MEPDRLEQRVGRIHGYGQEHDCLVFNFVAMNTREGHLPYPLTSAGYCCRATASLYSAKQCASFWPQRYATTASLSTAKQWHELWSRVWQDLPLA